MEDKAFIILGAVLFICLALAAPRLNDILYYVVSNFRATALIILSVLVGALGGSYYYTKGATLPDLADASSIRYAASIVQSSESRELSRIQNCKAFIMAESAIPASGPQNRPGQENLLHFASLSAPDWERCARVFGMNYWKHDISINGENGGHALCRVYRQQTARRSPETESWCTTVFANLPPQQ